MIYLLALVRRLGPCVQGGELHMIYFQSADKWDLVGSCLYCVIWHVPQRFMLKNISPLVCHGPCQFLMLCFVPSSITVVINLVWVTDLFWEYEESNRHSSSKKSITWFTIKITYNLMSFIDSPYPLLRQHMGRLRLLLLWVIRKNVLLKWLGNIIHMI